MKIFLLINALGVLITASCLSFTVTVGKQGGLTASIKRGSVVYNQFCLACHQANGGGVPNLNPPLIKTKFVLGNKKELAKIILKGLSGEIEISGEVYNNVMPPHNFLTDQQIADVLTFVRNSFGNKASAVTVAEVKAQRAKG